jgi:hypothetical protein
MKELICLLLIYIMRFSAFFRRCACYQIGVLFFLCSSVLGRDYGCTGKPICSSSYSMIIEVKILVLWLAYIPELLHFFLITLESSYLLWHEI